LYVISAARWCVAKPELIKNIQKTKVKITFLIPSISNFQNYKLLQNQCHE